ncbi:MAG: lytic transglycosylase domain-containing protein [Pseudomonadota bacterium]
MVNIRRAICTTALICFAGFAQADPTALGEAISAAASKDWARVGATRARISDPVARDLVDWMRLRGRQGTYSECRNYVERRADWPGMPLLRQRCEAEIPRGGNPDLVLAFFDGYVPRTATGSLRLAEAYFRKDRNVDGANELKRAWLTFYMTGSEHDAFVTRNGLTIKDLHEERLDMLLWRGQGVAARRMFPLVSDGWRRLAEARLGLRNKVKGVDNLIAAVPAGLRDHPGLAYERFLWRAGKGRTGPAIELLEDYSRSAEKLGNPSAWSNRRRSLAREMMREGKEELAYRLAAQHFLTDGSDYADLEWLSGFLALRKLGNADRAISHFLRFRDAVRTPISLGRAGYWLGRAYEAAGQAENAAEAYRLGAQYQSSFYGQLAAEAAGLATDPRMTGNEDFGDWKRAEFTRSSVFDAAIQLLEAGQFNLAERFLVHLGETQSREDLGRMGAMALDLGEPHLALMISKQAARQGHEIYKSYFPVATPAGLDLPISETWALSIARRESEFDPVVTSPAGARGLMQLMPRTAEEMAKLSDQTYSRARLLTDPDYNASLGATYLSEMSKRYGGNPILISVAYNAGPSRADRWSSIFGNPRRADVDVIDWIEYIPFRETRNYVMRVTESFAPYEAQLTGSAPKLTLLRDLKR